MGVLRVPPAGAGRAASASSGLGGARALDVPFYDPPDPLPSAPPGTLIRSEQVADQFVGIPARVYRVLYHSQSVQGADIAVSGYVAVPTGPVPDGGRTVLSWGHGTTGIADQCAPSRTLDKDAPGLAAAAQALTRGWVFAATDYEGLGTPGIHPHLVGVSEGRGMLDIVRAARQLPDAHADGGYLLWGQSQGGHAALFAAQIAASWMPGDPPRAVVTDGAPSTLLAAYSLLRNKTDRNDLFLTAVGYHAAYPEADLHRIVTDEGIEDLKAVEVLCYVDLVHALANIPTDRISKGDPADDPVWHHLIEENEPGTVATPYPLLMVHGELDDSVPLVAGKILYDRLCGLGQDVTFHVMPGRGHVDPDDTATAPLVASWLDARLAGEATGSTCTANAPTSTTTTSTTVGSSGSTTTAPAATPVGATATFTG